MRGVDAFYVKRGIRFGIAQLLRLCQHIGKVTALLTHFRKDKVTSTVDDPG